jgi:hypothetical protein
MQGIECKKRYVGVEEQAIKGPVRRRLTARGSGGSYAPGIFKPTNAAAVATNGSALHSAARQQPQRPDQPA